MKKRAPKPKAGGSLNDLPQVHHRTRNADIARNALTDHILRWRQTHGLTLTEEACILNQVLGETLRYLLRIDRHGTTDKKADEA